MITSSYLFLRHFVLLAHLRFLLMKFQTSQRPSKLVIYVAFNHQGTIKEYYVEIIPISKIVGGELSAPNIMKALIKFFDEINVPITQAPFSFIDNTTVNLGSQGDFERYIIPKVPIALWVGCNNHKLVLCLKHLLKEFPCVAEFDTTLLTVEEFLLSTPSSQLLAEIFRGLRWKSSTALPVCPNATWWTLMGQLAKHCMSVTRHRLVHLPYVITSERNLKHWVYSWPSYQKSSSHHYFCYVMYLKP